MSALEACLAPVSELVPHLRWRVGAAERAPTGSDLVGRDLSDYPDVLAAAVAASAEARGSADARVLGSLWWQAYSYRVAGTALAAWALTGSAPDVSTPGTGVAIARSRPSALLVDRSASVLTDLRDIVRCVFAGHLDPLAESLRSQHRVGVRLVWGNTAAAIASALGAVATAPDAPELRERVDEISAALPHGIGRLGAWAPDACSYRRKTCCLWWRTSAAAGALCEDCSLTPRTAVVGQSLTTQSLRPRLWGTSPPG